MISTTMTPHPVPGTELYDTVYQIKRGGGGILAIYFISEELTEANDYFLRAREDIMNRKYEKAIPELEKCIEIFPKHYNAHYFLSNAYHNKGLIDQAIKELKKTLELKPDHTYARQYLQQLLQSKK